MATIAITGSDLVVHIHGWDKLLALRSTLTVPLASVRAVVARPPDAQYDAMKGLKVAGGYWPGSFAAGYFWVTGGAQGERAHALEKLQRAREDLANGDDEGGHFAAAARAVDEAIDAAKKGLAAANAPEAASYLAFYDVHDPAKCVALDVEHGKLKRVVVELDEETPDAAVARIAPLIRR